MQSAPWAMMTRRCGAGCATWVTWNSSRGLIMYPPIPPTFQIGPITIHWYGITMVTAIFVGAWVASGYVARKGQDGNRVWDMLLLVLIPAFIGARLYYVFIQSPRGS